MKKHPLFTSTLIAASFALSALPVLADTVTLDTEPWQNYFDLSESDYTITAADYTIATETGSTGQGWFSVDKSGNENHAMAGLGHVAFASGTTFVGEGLIGIIFNEGDGGATEYVDLTNVDASWLTGQIIVVNNWNRPTVTQISGTTWSNVEYIFGNAVDDETIAEKYGLTGVTRGDLSGSTFSELPDTLELQSATTFAGVVGSSKDAVTSGSNNVLLSANEFLTVISEGTTLTIAGSSTYGFYGTVGSDTSGSVVRASLEMTGNGSQTFGGTNYLYAVTASAGTLILSGTNDISSAVLVNGGTLDVSGTTTFGSTVTVESGTLNLAGEITLSETISNSGTIVIADGTSFVLDNLEAGYSSGTGYYELIAGNGSSSSVSYTAGNITFIYRDSELSDWNIATDSNGNVWVYGEVGLLTWNGTESNNNWNTTDTNWSVDGDASTFSKDDNVVFGADTAYKVVNITEDVAPGDITVSDDYTFITSNSAGVVVDAGGTLTIASGKTLTIEEGVTLFFDHGTTAGWSLGEGAISGSGTLEFRFTAEYGDTINLGSGSTFTGTVYIVEGDFQFSGSNIGEGTYRFGDGVNVQQGSGNASVTVDNDIIIEGESELHVNSGGSLTINGDISGVETNGVMGGTVERNGAGTLTITGDVSIGTFTTAQSVNSASSTTSFQGSVDIGTLTIGGVGPVEFSGSGTIGTINMNAASTLTLTGGGEFTIGSYTQDAQNTTFAIGENTTVTVGTFSASWGETFSFGSGSVLNITEELSLHNGASDSFSGGTFNIEKINVYNYATPSFSNGTLNIGSGGIISSGNWGGWDLNGLTFGDGLTVGVYAGANENNTSWSTDATIKFSGTVSGTTFYTEEGQSITLSGTLTGAGFSNTGSGSLTLSGTVELSSSITNSGTIIVNSNTVFVLDNLKSEGNGTYVIINNVDSGSIEGWSNLTENSFYFTDGTEITTIDLSTAGQITISTNAVDLIWNGGSGTWDTSSSNWTISGTGTSSTFTKGDYVTFTGGSSDSVAITVSGDVSAAYVTVSGGTYSFTGSNITVREYFVINSEAEVDLGTSNSTIYGDFIVDGTLKLAGSSGSSGEIHGTITINDGGWVELDKGDVTGWGEGQGVTAITINKGGTLYVDTTENQTLGGCTLTLVGGTITGVDDSNLDLYHSSSKIVALAEDSATADNPTVSNVTHVTLTPRASDSSGGATEFFVDENAKLVVASGIRAGAGGTSTYNCDLEKRGAGTLEVSGFFALNTGSLIIDEGTVILSGTAGATVNGSSYAFASSVSVAEGALLNICFSEATTLSGVTFSGAGTIEVSGDNTLTINNYSFSGTTQIAEGSTLTITGTTASMGELALSGSSIVFNSSGESTATLSKVTVATSATISVSNWYDHITIGELVGSGTLSLGNSASDNTASIYELTGTSSQFTGTISLSETNSSTGSVYRGVTLVISSESAAAGAVIKFGEETNSHSSIALGVNASRVEIAGLTTTSTQGGDIIYSGSVALGAQLGDGGATLIDYKNQGYGEGSAYDGVGVNRNTLVINTAADTSYTFSGVILDKVNIEKTGAGTQSITFKEGTWQSENYFDGTIVVKEGTLNLSAETVTKGDASEKATTVNSSGITVAQGATLNIANDITLTTASDLDSCTSTISGNLGLSWTLTVSSDATLEIGSTASVTINSAISNSGTITIAEGASIVVGSDLEMETYTGGTNGDIGYYVLISGSGDDASVTLNGNVTFVINGESITLSEITTMADGGTTWKGYTVGGYLVIYEATTAAETAETLYWAGTDGNSTWSTSDTNTPWSDSDTGEAGYYFQNGENVIFGSSAATNTTVTVDGAVEAGSITVNSAYTFAIGDEASVKTGTLTYGEGGSLTLTGSGTFIFNAEAASTVFTINTDGSFTGNVEVVKGQLQLSGTSLGAQTGVVVHASEGTETTTGIYENTDVSIVFGGNGVSLASDITVEGNGGVIIRSGSSDNSGTLSGNISGADEAYLQLNGGGSVTLSGNVSLENGGYVNYQGSTTFSGETVKLGELILAQNTNGTSAVTFTNSVQATVGTLTVDSTGTDGAQKTLIVSGGAVLEITTGIALNHEVDIKLDNGTLKITGTEYSTSGNDAKMSVTISNGGTLSLGENVTLNVDVMNIVLGTENYDESGIATGVFAIVGGNNSSLTFTDNAVITITVDSALETLLSSEGTYYFDISNGIALNEGSLDYSALESYGTVSYTDGILSVVVPIPEPELFSIFFGIGALGLIATRRRRRKVA